MSEKINQVIDMVLKKAPVTEVHRILDYKETFVLDVSPSFVGFIAVRKDTGDIFGFNPMINDPDDFFKAWESRGIAIPKKRKFGSDLSAKTNHLSHTSVKGMKWLSERIK